ncbi:MAG TPA: phosphoenolpyruvate--protein phosphotransferase [Longimicrobiales bacterium]|nr:phosphoenolpyruvate--protein phosphotransferase [Longimicrobiales bacterium]
MSIARDGTPASPGIVVGPAHVLHWDMPRVPHSSIDESEIEQEIERFDEARAWTGKRVADVQRRTSERLGEVEARIFDPQILMLEDQDMIDRTVDYIRSNHLSAARAFELCMLEIEADWTRSGHPMVFDRLIDLRDMEQRMLRRLLGLPDPDLALDSKLDGVILVARDLTPTITVQLDRERIIGIATDAGTRTSHSAILARSLGLPAVVGLGDFSTLVHTGQEVALDGRSGRVVIAPTKTEKRLYRERDERVREWEHELGMLAQEEAVTPDHQPVVLRANIDMPGEAQFARAHGAQGVGLLRTEFLVVGRNTQPGEEEQYESYRSVAEAFPRNAVFIRTFDLGGDKFPAFLHMPPEENPFLGWRAIRVCLDTPDLFLPHLRAALRATAHGDVRIMLPLINEVSEIRRTRDMLDEAADQLKREGKPFNPAYKLGIMIETPAAALTANELARHADFFSIGTNDLIQYTLAVDRGNARLAPRFKPFHPAVVRLLEMTAQAGRAAGIEVSVCGEMAGNPLAVFLFLGLGISALSVGPSTLTETKKVIRSIPAAAARASVAKVMSARTPDEVVMTLREGLEEWLDVSMYTDRWNLKPEAGSEGTDEGGLSLAEG